MKYIQPSPPEHRPACHAPRHQPGFALLVTLSLLALLIVISLGFLSLSAVSLRSSSRGQAVAEAQANARMALMLAIGELQRELGPDKRVNAPASILSKDGGTTTSAQPGRRHWISSHDSWDSTSESSRPTSAFRKWLISGPETLTRDPASPTAQDPEDVVLWSSMPNDPNRVAVPKMPILDEATSVPKGSYAWWIGDENAKALISRLPDNLGNATLTRADAQASPTSAYHRSAALTGIDRTSANLDKLVSHGTLDLVMPPAIKDAADKSFHDFTTSSWGILTDVARGGLKRDLSLYLDHPVSEALTPKLPNTRRLYPNSITWEELWLYHNAWRALQPLNEPGLRSTTGGDLTNAYGFMTPPGTMTDSIAAFRADPFAIYKLPVFLRFQWLVSLWATERTPATDPKQYNLHTVSDPIFTVWNPMDVPIALHPQSLMSFKLIALPYNFRFINENNQTVTRNFREAVSGNVATNPHLDTFSMGTGPIFQYGRTGTADPVVLMPGEVLILSRYAAPTTPPALPVPVPWTGPGTSAAKPCIALKAGWDPTAGTYRPLPSFPSPVTDSTTLRFEAYPNASAPYGGWCVQLDRTYGPDARHPAVTNAYFEFLNGIATTGTATANPHVFPSFLGNAPELQFPKASLMTGTGKYPFFLFTYQTKPEENPTSWSRTYNPRNTNIRLGNLQPLTLALTGYEIKVESLKGPMDFNMPKLSINQINRGLFGGSYSDYDKSVDTIVVQSIPREPPLSLGAFQHAIASGLTTRMNGQALSPNMPAPQSEVSHSISNSYAHPMIPPTETSSGNFTDHSYHVNRMLWDSWFLSSIVQRQSPHHTDKKTARQIYQDFLANPTASPLPNRRMKPTGDAVAGGPDELFDASHAAHELASSKLMVEGAFNVNSASVDAWKAVLGSMEGIHVPVATNTNNPASTQPHLASGTPVHGLLNPSGTNNDRNTAEFTASDTTKAGKPAQWCGYRNLSPSEINDLATELVREIRDRGPFLSMSDFINRRLYGSTEDALCGTLQAALDRSVNKSLFAEADRVGSDPTGVFINSEAAKVPKSMIAPLHVKQADILTSIGSQLAVRSDTFRIRAYGESVDRNGNVVAKAWCEAVVQRLPQYIDAIDGPEAADAPTPDPEPRTVPPLTSDANRAFGRRIEIQSFRWLSPEEIQS